MESTREWIVAGSEWTGSFGHSLVRSNKAMKLASAVGWRMIERLERSSHVLPPRTLRESTRNLMAECVGQHPTQTMPGAVEQMARILIGDASATLAEAIKELRGSGRVAAPLLKGIEEIWGLTSQVPGVRHGSASLDSLDPAVAQYVISQAAAALALLLSKDAA